MPYGNARHLVERAQQFWNKADEEDRPLTPDERYQVEQLHERAKQAKALEEQLGEFEGGGNWTRGQGGAMGKGPGDQFIQSKGYKDLLARGLGSGAFSTGQVEVSTKGTLTTTPGTALTPGGYVPGITEILAQRLYVADLFPQAQAPMGGEVRYVQETTATNAAAAVAETGAKPESTLVFGEVSEPIRKIATLLPDLGRTAGGRAAGQRVPEPAAKPVRPATGGGAAAHGLGHGAQPAGADRHHQDDRDLHPGHRRQRHGPVQGHEPDTR